MKMLKIKYTLLIALTLMALLPGALQAQYGPYKNGASVSGKASIDDKSVDDNTDVTFNFPMIGLGKVAATPVFQVDGSYVITYTFKVKNYGQENLTNVQVKDTLTNTFPSPATYSVTSVTATGTLHASATYTGAADHASLLDAATSTLAVGDSATITLVVKLFNNNTFSFNNTATATAETSDATQVFDVSVNSATGDANGNGNPFDDKSPTPVTIPKPDIAVVKSADIYAPYAGNNVVFTVTVNNNGPGNAVGVVVKDVLPDGFTLVTAVPSTGTYNTANGEWTIGILNTTDPAVTLTVTATVKPSGNYINEAISQIPNDADVSNDKDTAAIVPIASANLEMVKRVSNTAPYTGQQVTFKLVAINHGPSEATGVVVRDTLKTGFTLVTPLPSGVTYNTTTRIITWAAGTIVDQDSAFVNLVAAVNSGFTAADYINRAVVTGNEYDPVSTNDTSVVILTPLESVDLVMDKTITAATPLYAGKNVTFTLTVTNNGPSSATNVKVEDLLRPGYVFGSANPSAAYNSTTGVWTVGTLASGASASLTITAAASATGSAYDYGNVATVTSNEFDTDYTNNTDSITAPTVTPLVDLAVTKSVDVPNAHVGNNVVFTVTVTNNGPSNATGVTVNDLLPDGFKFASATPAAAYNATTGVWNIGNLNNGASATLLVTAMVNPASKTTTVNYKNIAQVTGNERDENALNDTASATVTPVPTADLAVTKTVDKSTPDAGSNVVFTITATNNGLSHATGVVVNEALKTGYTFVSATPSGTTAYDKSTGVWTIGNLDKDATATLEITATVNPDKTAAEYENTVTISGNENDDTPGNNTATETPVPVPVADLAITKTASSLTPDAGADITFTLLAENKGVSDATSVSVTDVLPAGYTYKSHSTATGTYDNTTGSWNIATLAAGANATLTITATVIPDVTSTDAYKNTAVITGAEKDPVTTNNTSTSTPVPVPVTDLEVKKEVDNATAHVGNNVVFTVTVINHGPSKATGVSVADLLPDGFQFKSAVPAAAYNATSGVWTIGDINSGDSTKLTVTAMVNPAPKTGAINYVNTATVTGNEKDPVSSNNTGTSTVTPVPTADLEVTKTVDKATPDAGSNVVFTITATNKGLSHATGVVVNEALKTGYTFVSATVSGTTTYDETTGVWTIGNLDKDATATLTITATVNPGKTAAEYGNTATISGNENDDTPGNNTSTVTPVPVPVADLAITKTASNLTPDAGSDITFTLLAENKGVSDATSVSVTDVLPAGYTYKSHSTATGTYDNTTGIWNIATLAAGANATLTITATVVPDVTSTDAYKNTAVITGAEKDPVTTNNTSTSTPVPVPVTDLEVKKEVDNATAHVGNNVVFTVTVINHGPSKATGVSVADLLPDGFQFKSAVPAAAYNATSGVWTIGNINSGDSTKLTVTAMVNPAPKTGAINYVNTATVTGNEKDPVSSNNTGTSTVTPVPTADLEVTKTVDKATPDAGSNVVFTITATNKGLSHATGVVVNEALKTGYTFVSATVSGTTTYNETTGVWTIGNLDKDATATLTITATVNPGKTAAEYGNTATISGNENDDTPGNNTSTVTPVPVPVADLAITKTASSLTPDAGADITFTLLAENKGVSDATSVSVTDVLPAGYTYKSHSTATGTYDNTTGSWNIATLAAGANATLTITATVVPDVTSIDAYKNTAVISGAEKDPDANNNTSSSTPVPVAVTDLAVTKQVNVAKPDVGAKVIFTIEVVNNGPSKATNVVVTDVLPTGYTYESSIASTGTYTNTNGTWAVGALAANAKATLTVTATVQTTGNYTNQATVTGNEKDPVTTNNTSSVTPEPVPVADLAVVKTVSNTTPDKGTEVTFTITVTNKGLSDATNVVATDVLASGYKLNTASADQGTYDAASGVWTIGSLAAGKSVVLTVTAGVNATGVYSNTATVTATEKDPDATNNTSTVTPVPVDITDLVLTKDISNTTPEAGSQVTFTITVTNKGINDATQVVVAEKLKDGYAYISNTASAGTYNAVTGEWTIGNLANGATATLQIVARVNASGEYGNTATVTGHEKDPVPDNNSKTVLPSPVPVIDLAVTKEVNKIKPDAGEEVTFTVKVVNNGPSTATNVIVNEVLPTGYTYVIHSVNRGTYLNGVWNLGILDSSKTGELVITAKVNAKGDYLNTVTVSGLQKDVDMSNNTASATVEPVPVADMQITKTASSTGFNKDQQITFTLVARNNGPSTATNIKVTDVLKDGYTYVSMTADMGSFDATTGVWSIASLDSGKEATAKMVVIAKATGAHDNTATVTANEKDKNTANNTSTVTLALNPDPIAVDDAAATEEPTPFIIKVLDNDKAQAGTLVPTTVVIKTQPQHGKVTVNADGTVTYTPTEGYEGTDEFTYTVKDSNGNESNVATVTVTVTKRKIDLAITKRIVTAHEQIAVGKDVTFEIVVTNKSTKKASGVEVADILAANLGVNDVKLETKTGTAVFDAANRRITWTIGSMEGGATATLTVTTRVIAGGAVENTAVVAGTDEDSDMTNNTATVTANSDNDDIFIPNVITPNGDGKNDKLVILGLSRYPGSSIMIYNRWGNMVYQSSDYKNDWNGIGLNDGTYYYVLTVNKPAGKKIYKGWIQKLN